LSATHAGVVGPERQTPRIDEVGVEQLRRARDVGDQVTLHVAADAAADASALRDGRRRERHRCARRER
jgi:hypothetical protein